MKLPNSWRDINLKTLARLHDIWTDTELDDTDKDIETICQLSGISYLQALELSFAEKTDALKSIQFINTLDTLKTKIPKYFWLKSTRYRLTTDMRELTGGQYIDLMTFLKDPDANLKNIHNVLAVLATPMKYGLIRTRYNGTDHPARAILFNDHLPVSMAYPIMVFFCNLSEYLTKALQDYLKEANLNMRNLTNQTNSIKPTAG